MVNSEVVRRAGLFREELARLRQGFPSADFGWYPYDTLSNLTHIDRLLNADGKRLLDLTGAGPVLDVGTGDGDFAFFLESLGVAVHAMDHGPTNFNGCRGVRRLRDALQSKVVLHELDLDSQFDLPAEHFTVAFLLGILYHLKNPFYILESLARRAAFLVFSTRITRYNRPRSPLTPPDGQLTNSELLHLRHAPVAYLVDPNETNNDPTNYWIFSETGLERLLRRTGWHLTDLITVGNVVDSDPATSDGDERAFGLAQSSSR